MENVSTPVSSLDLDIEALRERAAQAGVTLMNEPSDPEFFQLEGSEEIIEDFHDSARCVLCNAIARHQPAPHYEPVGHQLRKMSMASKRTKRIWGTERK